MIISRTPLRISFVGGGSDLESFYRHHDGAVVSSAIDKYIYITLNKNFDPCIRLKYSRVEEKDGVEELEHNLIRESLRLAGVDREIEITSLADIPDKGTGLGSSSAYVVGVLHALHAHKNLPITKEDLARKACQIEIDILKNPIGKQDQYIAAYGGLNFIKFHSDGKVAVQPIVLKPEVKEELQDNMLLFYTGITRKAGDILTHQKKNYEENEGKRGLTKYMVRLAEQLKEEFLNNRLESFGEILHENWNLKKQLADCISNPQIDAWYEAGLKAGAKGGKLIGAGGGGFLFFYAPKEKHQAIISALKPLRHVKVKMEDGGSKIYDIKNLSEKTLLPAIL